MLIDLSTGFVVCAIEGFLDTIDDYLDSSGYSIGSTGQLINQKKAGWLMPFVKI